MKLQTANYNFENFKKIDKYQQKIDYAQKIAKKEAGSPNIESYEFVDVYSQSYLNAYEEKKKKIKNIEKVKNAVLGCFALIFGFVSVILLSTIKKL
jgi:hypothetical protein